MPKSTQRVIVIGAGMAGLTAARELIQAGIQVTVLEKNAYVGGRVRTDTVNDFKIEIGAQFLTDSYTNTRRLIRALGLQEHKMNLPPRVAILRHGRLIRLVPTATSLFTPLLSFRSKLLFNRPFRVMLRHFRDLDMRAFAKSQKLDTHSVAEYAGSQLNQEILNYALEPGLSGVFYWTPERTSQVALFLFIKGIVEKGGAGTRLFSLRDGLGELPHAMAATLPVRLSARVTRVTWNAVGDCTVNADVDGQNTEFTADGVVCAVPGVVVPELFPNLSDSPRDFFDQVAYSSTAIAAIGINHRLPTDLFSVYFPRDETSLKCLAAAVILGAKQGRRGLADRDVVSLYSSGPAGKQLLFENDAVIRARLLSDARQVDLLRFPDQDELFYRVYRWPEALPEFQTGYLKHLAAFTESRIASGRVVFAGDYLTGPFIEGAVGSGIDAANRLRAALESA
jgi:oxygen-dependent protoporphyrinogen oxidase